MLYSSRKEMAEVAELARIKLTLNDISAIETFNMRHGGIDVRLLNNYLKMLGYALCIRPLRHGEPIEPRDPFEATDTDEVEPAEAGS